MRRNSLVRNFRNGSSNTVTTVLLGGILVCLMVLIVVLLKSRDVAEMETDRPPAPQQKAVNDPNWIKETLQVGRTYQSVLKVGFTARVEDEDWGIQQLVTLAYLGEAVINRTIEANDGKRVVELRHFEACRSMKVLTSVDEARIDLGAPGQMAMA